MHDTYFAMLERPELRRESLMRYRIEHSTASFCSDVYAASAGIDFGTEEEAYTHWLTVGRNAGHLWAPGRDTLLKIVLKAKDETDLIDHWVAHHAAIVGYENLVILDCGSQDPAYLRKLAAYASRLLVIDYPRYYDWIHATRSNADLFGLLAANCRYLTILDADEFLLGRSGDEFSAAFVKPILRARDLPVFCGTWVTASGGIDGPAGAAGIDVSPAGLWSGTVAGKAIGRHDVIFPMGHLGHNLHVSEVVRLVSPKAFGEILVLHLRNFPAQAMRRRLLQHLVAKGAIGTAGTAGRDDEIAALAEDPDVQPAVRGYAQAYLHLLHEPEPPLDPNLVSATLVNAPGAQQVPELAAGLAALDWPGLLDERRAALGVST